MNNTKPDNPGPDHQPTNRFRRVQIQPNGQVLRQPQIPQRQNPPVANLSPEQIKRNKIFNQQEAAKLEEAEKLQEAANLQWTKDQHAKYQQLSQ